MLYNVYVWSMFWNADFESLCICKTKIPEFLLANHSTEPTKISALEFSILACSSQLRSFTYILEIDFRCVFMFCSRCHVDWILIKLFVEWIELFFSGLNAFVGIKYQLKKRWIRLTRKKKKSWRQFTYSQFTQMKAISLPNGVKIRNASVFHPHQSLSIKIFRMKFPNIHEKRNSHASPRTRNELLPTHCLSLSMNGFFGATLVW